MNVATALEQIRFWSGTISDITNKSTNDLFSNNNIVRQLMFALNEYARTTKAIEDIYSFPLDRATPYIDAPPLALRSEAYRGILIIIQGRYFPGDMQSFNNVYPAFPYPSIQGITNWIMPWGSKPNDLLYVFPMKSVNSATTTITANVDKNAATIPVASTVNFQTNSGKFTIGTEKIYYDSIDTLNFYGCRRGQEQTEAANHSLNDTIIENSVWLFYSRLHTDIVINGNAISKEVLGQELEISEEHIETVLKYTAYNLLLKIDPNRAAAYKLDYTAFLDKAKYEIKKGRSRIRQGATIRDPFYYESSQAFTPNIF